VVLEILAHLKHNEILRLEIDIIKNPVILENKLIISKEKIPRIGKLSFHDMRV
jgi:hypothetical protein